MIRDERTHAVIGAAMEVHNVLGPDFLEAVYPEALEFEFKQRELPFLSKPKIRIEYKGRKLASYYVLVFLAFDAVVVEIKAQACLTNADEAQIINCLKSMKKETGLLINFGEFSLKWRRFIGN